MNETVGMPESILERWNVTPEELTEIVDRNPSLRGMILGYLAELKLEKLWLTGADVSSVIKYDDHDRKKKGDRSSYWINAATRMYR